MSIYDVSSVIHPIPEYKTSKHGIIYTNIICKDKKVKRWSSSGRVLWSWCIYGGLLNGLDQDFGSIVSSAGVMGSDGLRRSEMEWEVWCVWSQGVQGSVGILATSLGFAKGFCKSPSISQVNFAIWRPFWSLEVISQPFQSLEIIS